MSHLNQSTLVLNRSWLAVQVTSVKRAIALLYQGHAKVVDEDFQSYNFQDWSEVSQQMVEVSPEEFICSPSVRIRIPRVIVLVFYDKLPQRDVKFSRKNIFERDKYTCQYCGTKPPNRKQTTKWLEQNSLNLDHVVPRSRGGKTTWTNVVASCYRCNSKKANHTLEELGWKLKQPPRKPEWRSSISVSLGWKPRKEWRNFLDVVYWNTELDNDNLPN